MSRRVMKRMFGKPGKLNPYCVDGDYLDEGKGPQLTYHLIENITIQLVCHGTSYVNSTGMGQYITATPNTMVLFINGHDSDDNDERDPLDQKQALIDGIVRLPIRMSVFLSMQYSQHLLLLIDIY